MRAQHVSIICGVGLLLGGCVEHGPGAEGDAELPAVTVDGGGDAEAMPDAVVGVPDGTVSASCGDGIVDVGEACDDGNEISGDGCENDCTYTCATDEQCELADLCTFSRCRSDHTCLPPSRSPNGTGCDVDMDVGTRDVCFDGVCVPSMCGDGLVDEGAGEDCDDGNAISGDGCESDCTFSCTTDAECETGNPCLRSQCSASHACTVPSSMSGAICDADADPSTRDICVFGNCQASSCGDGVQDPGAGEICDDGDDISGNGCESDCTWSCTSNAECDDGDPCDGTEYCNRTTHTCVHPGVFGLC